MAAKAAAGASRNAAQATRKAIIFITRCPFGKISGDQGIAESPCGLGLNTKARSSGDFSISFALSSPPNGCETTGRRPSRHAPAQACAETFHNRYRCRRRGDAESHPQASQSLRVHAVAGDAKGAETVLVAQPKHDERG